jgi:hypothetical protein
MSELSHVYGMSRTVQASFSGMSSCLTVVGWPECRRGLRFRIVPWALGVDCLIIRGVSNCLKVDPKANIREFVAAWRNCDEVSAPHGVYLLDTILTLIFWRLYEFTLWSDNRSRDDRC